MNVNNLRKLWNDKGFEIILGLCVAFIIIGGLYSKITGRKGTWSSSRTWYTPYYTYSQSNHKTPSKRAPPRESKGELECRRVLENVFRKPFTKARPSFLNNPVTGGYHNLELDCFNTELRLACEYNGVQHYKFIPFFHKNKEAFRNQQYRDYMKATLCKENGVMLINVPYSVNVESIEEYLKRELRKNGYKV